MYRWRFGPFAKAFTLINKWWIAQSSHRNMGKASFVTLIQESALLSRTCRVFTRGQFWPSGIVVACVCVSVCSCVRVCVCQSRACPHDNSPLVQARITKFVTKVQKTLVKVPIVFGDDRPWPSRSNLTWKSNFTSFWACPPHNSSAVHARITKFGPKMHLSTVKMPINFGEDWFWSSPSFLILKPIFRPNLFALCLYYI